MIQHAQLQKDVQMPMVGFGTYLISSADAAGLVAYAIGAGYRLVDTAEGYQNEDGVGSGIQASIEDGTVTRAELFVTTKLWPGNAKWGETPKTFDATIEACHASLARMQLDYVDLYLIHAPFQKEHRLEQWRALVALQKQGKVRAIGVSNFTQEHIDDIIAAGLPLPALNQIELHPWSQKPELVNYLAGKGIFAMAYSSLVPLSSWRDAEGQDSAKTAEMKADSKLDASPLKSMSAKYSVSESQLLLRWGIQKGFAVIPKSTKTERMKLNLDIFDFKIDAPDMAIIATLDRGDGVAWAVGDPSNLA
jgi:2,5-diketo-D-gluconate reductase A